MGVKVVSSSTVYGAGNPRLVVELMQYEAVVIQDSENADLSGGIYIS